MMLLLHSSEAIATRRWGWRQAENTLSVMVLTAMTLLPIAEIVSRKLRLTGIPGGPIFVQHLTLWVALAGAALAARSDQLLSLAGRSFLPTKWQPSAHNFTSAIAVAVSSCLAWASLRFVLAERAGGAMIAGGVPRWMAQAVLPAGFVLIAWRLMSKAPTRYLAATGLLVPLGLALAPALSRSAALLLGIAMLMIAALAGLPIFATLGGMALLLFWNAGVPVASVPVETYRLVASPVLPSIPLFTLAGYLLVEGGASRRLLRVYGALFGWLPGGLAITTAVVCAIFTWGGSGLTILSLGALLVPMLVGARYPEKPSIGLVNASGSLGLLFPPSLPVILYGIYAHTAIGRLFVAGFVPGLVMVALVCAWGVREGLRSHATRSTFSWGEAREAVWEAKWELVLPVIVMAGLFGGLGTLVEAAALTVLYSFLVEFLVYRDLSLRRDYARVLVECATVVGGVLLILGVAAGLTNYLMDAQMPTLMIAWVQGHIHSRYLFLLLLNGALLVVGSMMDIFSAIIVIVPLIAPLGNLFGIDPAQLGIVFLANLELGYLTPPVGMNLCLSAYRFRMSMASVYRATLPFYLILLAGVLLITYVDVLTTGPLRWLGL